MDEITIDTEEMRLLDLYKQTFNETPPVALLDPEASKTLIKQAFKAKSLFNPKDLAIIY